VDDFTHATNLVSHLFPWSACVSQPLALAAPEIRARLLPTSLPELSRLIRNNGAHSLQNPFGIRLGNIGNLGPTFIVNLFVPRLFYQRFLDLVWHTNIFSQAIAFYPTRSH